MNLIDVSVLLEAYMGYSVDRRGVVQLVGMDIRRLVEVTNSSDWTIPDNLITPLKRSKRVETLVLECEVVERSQCDNMV